MENGKLIAIIIAVALFAATLTYVTVKYTGETIVGAAVTQTSGTVCCTFERNGAEKTCIAPDGAGCETCDGVCAQVGA